MNKTLIEIASEQGWKILNSTPVHGGDINQAFCIETNHGKFFIKLNDAAKYPQMFEKEANGLRALQKHFTLTVPSIVAVGKTESQQYLALEWLQVATPTNKAWEDFGHALAIMHRTTNENFGWCEDTFIASIAQSNSWSKSWAEFYTQYRIMPLVTRLRNEHTFTEKDVQHAEKYCFYLANAIPDETPALLHGDLWSGNVMAVSANDTTTMAIFDPDVYYGHREVDIAMTKLFGGFPTIFHDAYNEIYPLQNGWKERLPMFQLYPLLVHAVLFGGGYVGRVKSIIAIR
jgi:protein-ribulosamine 3-kinase